MTADQHNRQRELVRLSTIVRVDQRPPKVSDHDARERGRLSIKPR